MLVRRARPEDGPRLLALVRELAEYEKLDPPTPEAEARLLRDAFAPRPRFDVLLAERDGEVVGYAAILETYSTFRARPVLHLEDLFVTVPARRQGAATALLAACAREAVVRGCARLSWVVLDWNVDAQRFYERMGAARMAGWLPYALEGGALARAAGATGSV